MESKVRRILGVDPGTNIMGYGIISVTGNNISLIKLDVVKLDKNDDHAEKLQQIFSFITSIIAEHDVTEFAIEAPFFGKNVQSMLKLGRAQGVAIAAAISMQLKVREYSPKRIKQSVTGNGNASKEQVAAMLESILKQPVVSRYLDATDGLAVAVCHYFQKDIPQVAGKKMSGWGAFIKSNPERLG